MGKPENISTYPEIWNKPPFITNSTLRWGIIIGAVIYLIAALASMDINPQRIVEGIPRGQRFIASFFPPNFADNRGVVWDGILESIWMAIISTVVGIALSVPIGLGAARNLAPFWVYITCRSIIAGSRTFPEIILAIFPIKILSTTLYSMQLNVPTFKMDGFNEKPVWRRFSLGVQPFNPKIFPNG